MSLWGKLLGSTEVIKQAADGIYHGVDKAIYTPEEKAEGFLQLLKAYEPFKLAQRYLMLLVSIPYVSLHAIASLQILLVGWFGGATGKALHESALVLMEQNNETLGLPFAIIVSFYLGGGAVEGVVNRFRQKQSGKS